MSLNREKETETFLELNHVINLFLLKCISYNQKVHHADVWSQGPRNYNGERLSIVYVYHLVLLRPYLLKYIALLTRLNRYGEGPLMQAKHPESLEWPLQNGLSVAAYLD